MSLLTPPASILTHKAEGDPLAVTLKQQHDHMTEAHPTLFAGSAPVKVLPPSDFPRHVHSTTAVGSHFVVNSEEEREEKLATGDWADEPLEVKKKEVIP